MRTKLAIKIAIILFVVLFAATAVGCKVSRIVGKWQNVEMSQTIEFTKAGEFKAKYGPYGATGTYELIGSNVIKLNPEGASRGWLRVLEGDPWEYEITGDTMTVVEAGNNSTFKRINATDDVPK